MSKRKFESQIMAAIVSILLVAVTTKSVVGEDIFIAQSSSGMGNGQSSLNPHGIDWFNDSSNWNEEIAEDGKIGPGDTVFFLGVISERATIQGSGISGNYITLTFHNGAKFSSDVWSTSGAIYAVDKSWIILDGANTGDISAQGNMDGSDWNINVETTDNGTNLSHSSFIRAVYFYSGSGGGCGNIIIRNMKVINTYQRVPNSTDRNDGGTGIMVESYGNVSITNNYVEGAENGFYIKGSGTNVSGLKVSNNRATKVSNGIHFACKSTNHTTSGGEITGNRINLTDTWNGGPHHNDGIQTISSQSGNRIYRLHVAYNHIGPDYGTDGDTNAPIFLEDGVVECYIYNNFIEIGAGEVLSNPAITAGTGAGSWTGNDGEGLIANNTIIGATLGNQGIRGPRMKIYGNLIQNIDTLMSNDVTRSEQKVDYNIFYPDSDYYDSRMGAIYNRLDAWRTAGWDMNSIVSNAGVQSDGTLRNGSSAIDFAPTQTIFSDDFYGKQRVGKWDAGAFEFDGNAGGFPPNNPLNLVLVNNN